VGDVFYMDASQTRFDLLELALGFFVNLIWLATGAPEVWDTEDMKHKQTGPRAGCKAFGIAEGSTGSGRKIGWKKDAANRLWYACGHGVSP
jgi:hypothetical protein